MYYADALNLIEICVENDILKEQDGAIFTYRTEGKLYPESWYLMDVNILANELRHDKNGQEALILALKEKEVIFEEKYRKTSERLGNILN